MILICSLIYFLKCSRFIIHPGLHTSDINCSRLRLIHMVAIIIDHICQTYLIIVIFRAVMRMSVKQNRSLPHSLPAENGIVAQHQVMGLAIHGIHDLLIITDLLKQPLISVVRNIVMVSSYQDLAALQCGNISYQAYISYNPHSFIYIIVIGYQIINMLIYIRP